MIQVITTGRGSLREKIMTDPQLRRFDLIPTEHQRPGRPHGWAKIHSETAHGAINLEMARTQQHFDLPGRHEIGKQAELDHR